MHFKCLIVFIQLFFTVSSANNGDRKWNLNMPNVHPKMHDTYLCNRFKVKGYKEYITQFEPNAQKETAHHMLLYTCTEPGSQEETWNCGEMHAKGEKVDHKPVCKSGYNIIYAWAMNADKLKLPKDVSFEIGSETDSKYLVLQIHYKNVEKITENGDTSGLLLTLTNQITPYLAGVYLMGTGGVIAANSITYMETNCRYLNDQNIYAFAYRVHAHEHGRVISGYRIRSGIWTEIGRMNPQKKQMFYNVSEKNPIDIRFGDMLAARCTMDNLGNDKAVSIGSTMADEMCNFYVMYFRSAENRELVSKNCWSNGPPFDSWEKNSLFGAPTMASTDPFTDQYFPET